MSNFTVGLTGGIGSGKTTVANMFAQQGITIVDADIVSRQVVAPNSAALRDIILYFGDEFLQTDGNLNRAKLRQAIFNNSEAKAWLNNLLHPLIRKTLFQQLAQANSPYSLLVAPLLIENNLHQSLDRTLVIDVNETTQLQRTMQRDNNSKQLVKQIMQSQLSREKRLAIADDVIDNTDFKQLKPQVEQLHQHYLQLAKNTAS